MKTRLLSTTAALSIALTSVQPLPLLAQQQGQRGDCTAENPEDCQPRRKGDNKPANDGGGQQEKRNRKADEARSQQDDRPAGEQRATGADAAPDRVRPAARQGGTGPDAAPDRDRPAGRAGEAVDAPERPRANRERPADEPDAGRPREQQGQARSTPDEGGTGPREARPAGEDAAPRAERRDGDGPDGEELRRRLQQDAQGGDRPPRETTSGDGPVVGNDPDRPRSNDDNDSPVGGTTAGGEGGTGDRGRTRAADQDGRSPEIESPVRERNRTADEDGRSPEIESPARERNRTADDDGRSPEMERPRREQARRSLDRALDAEEGSTEAAAASAASAEDAREAAQDARRAARRAERITEDNSRSSFEEFATRAGDTRVREDDDDDDDDDDGGLSNFEKFGLLALGGLAVGALLNNNRDEVVSNSGDRVVVQRADGTYAVLKDDDTLLRRPGSEVVTQAYDDGSTRSVVTREDGTQIVTIRDASGRVLRRTAFDRYGQEVRLIDDFAPVERVDLSRLPAPAPVYNFTQARDPGQLRDAFEEVRGRDLGRSYSLRQIRDYREVRALAPAVDVDQITFDSGSAAIHPDEAEKLATLGQTIAQMIAERPDEVFLIEGHTDAVGSAASNLTLSDRRAESVALALSEYYGVPPENLVVQGYGEEDLRVDTEESEQRNRRVAVRLITPLLQTASN